jgi:hypothetical protein
VVAVAAWFGAPAWLTYEDALARCPVVVALNGDPFARADTAALLYHEGFANEVWLTDDPKSSDAQGDAGSASNTRRLLALSVPEQVIRRVPGAAVNTRAEMELIGVELRRRRLACGIAVTSPLHGRRVRLTWDRHVKSPALVVRYAAGANYVERAKVLRELGASMAVIAGLD